MLKCNIRTCVSHIVYITYTVYICVYTALSPSF